MTLLCSRLPLGLTPGLETVRLCPVPPESAFLRTLYNAYERR